jgi:hypothetical protein
VGRQAYDRMGAAYGVWPCNTAELLSTVLCADFLVLCARICRAAGAADGGCTGGAGAAETEDEWRREWQCGITATACPRAVTRHTPHLVWSV